MLEKISKTKQLLIDAARELFGNDGKNNVTMNDIATASQKGRRTLYTYFKNKDEIYRAVVDNEMQIVVDALKANAEQNVDPYTKLKGHVATHLDYIKKIVTRNGSLRADFFRDIYEVERSRRKMDITEQELLRSILEEGMKTGDFKHMDADMISVIILYSLKGLEVPYIRQSISFESVNKDEIFEFIFKGIRVE